MALAMRSTNEIEAEMRRILALMAGWVIEQRAHLSWANYQRHGIMGKISRWRYYHLRESVACVGAITTL